MHRNLSSSISIISFASVIFFVNALVDAKNSYNILRASRTTYQKFLRMIVPSLSNANEDRLIFRYDSPFLSRQGDSSNGHTVPSALIILNTQIVIDEERKNDLPGVLSVLWESSSYRICADGGANRLYQATVTARTDNNDGNSDPIYLPDLITGDLDSLLPHVREYYEVRGVPIVRIEDQNFHDLDKSFMAVETWIDAINASKSNMSNDGSMTKTKLFIYGGFGGRFDQEMGCLNALFVWGKNKKFRHTSMALYGEETCAFLLPATPNVSEIRIRFPDGHDESTHPAGSNRKYFVGEGPTCGLIPIGCRCENVLTTGLKWNLEGGIPLQFGGLVSSSNRVMAPLVTVESSSDLIFTTEIVAIKPLN